MKTIETLVQDIHSVFQLPHEFDDARLKRFTDGLGETVKQKMNATSGDGGLRMSNIGTKCHRKLWYAVNEPKSGAPLPVETRVKFLYGDILEHLLLFLAEEAGHTVEGTQDTVTIEGVEGHRDAIIDGVLVDVKSASSMSFKKFQKGLTYEEDAFGYIDQLQGYLAASQEDPLLKDKSRAAFLVIDKTLGHIHLDIHKRNDTDYPKLVNDLKKTVSFPAPPPRFYRSIPVESKSEQAKRKGPLSGNMKLDTACSYCDRKAICWPTLRTFIYSSGPVFLTEVRKVPNVPEA